MRQAIDGFNQGPWEVATLPFEGTSHEITSALQGHNSDDVRF